MTITITSITKVKKKKRYRDYSDIDPKDLNENGEPYDNYSSPCIEPHPFGGGIKASEY